MATEGSGEWRAGGASRGDLRWAERRGQESLPSPVSPGYRPVCCLEALPNGRRATTQTMVYSSTHASPAARRFGFRAVGNQDTDSNETSVEIDAHAVLIELLGCVVPPRRKRGRSTTPIIAEA